MHKHTSFSIHSCRESRLARFAGEASNFQLGREESEDLKKDLSFDNTENPELSLRDLVSDVNATIGKYEEGLKNLPMVFGPTFRRNVVQFLLSQEAVRDADKSQSLSAEEFAALREEAINHIDALLAQYAAGAEQQESKKKEMEAAAESASRAAETAEKIEDVDITEIDIPEDASPEEAQEAFLLYQAQSGTFRHTAGKASQDMAAFQDEYQKFEEAKKGFGVLARPASLVANTIGIATLGIGMAVLDWMGVEVMKDPETEKLRKKLREFKDSMAERMDELGEKKIILQKNGEEMNRQDDDLLVAVETKYEEDVGLADAEGAETEEYRATAEEQLAELSGQQDALEEARLQMEEYRRGLEEQQALVTEAEEGRKVGEEKLQEFGGLIGKGLEQIEAALANPNLPEKQRAALKEQRDALLRKQELAGQGQEQLGDGEAATEQASEDLAQAQEEIVAKSQDIEHVLGDIVDPVIVSVEDTLLILEDAAEQIAVRREGIERGYDESLEAVSTLGAEIGSAVLENDLANETLHASVEKQHEWLKTVEIKPPGLWESSIIGFAFGKIGEGIAWLNTKVFDEGIFALHEWVKGKLSEIHPALGVAFEVTTLPVTLSLGACEAAIGMIGGIATIVAHPVDAVKGLGALIGRDPQTGEWSWGTVGGAWGTMIGWEHLSEGNVGRGLGHAALNIALALIPGGQAGTGAGVAARAAGLAGRISQAGRLGKIGLYARAIATRPGTFIKFTAKETVAGFARVPGAPLRMARGLVRTGRGLNARAIGLADDIGRLEGQIGRTAVNGRTIVASEMDDLARGSLDDLCRRFGVDDANTSAVYEAMRVHKMLRERVGMQEALVSTQAKIAAASKAKALEELQPGLGELTTLKSEKLTAFCEEMNASGRLLREHTFEVLHQTDNGFVIVDQTGMLRYLEDPAEISRLLGEGPAGDMARLKVADGLIERSLSAVEQQELLRVHRRGPSISEVLMEKQSRAAQGLEGPGKTALRAAREKGHDLIRVFEDEWKARGVAPEQARRLAKAEVKKLMDRGIAGTATARRAPAIITPELIAERQVMLTHLGIPEKGKTITVNVRHRDKMITQERWIVRGRTHDGCIVLKDPLSGKIHTVVPDKLDNIKRIARVRDKLTPRKTTLNIPEAEGVTRTGKVTLRNQEWTYLRSDMEGRLVFGKTDQAGNFVRTTLSVDEAERLLSTPASVPIAAPAGPISPLPTALRSLRGIDTQLGDCVVGGQKILQPGENALQISTGQLLARAKQIYRSALEHPTMVADAGEVRNLAKLLWERDAIASGVRPGFRECVKRQHALEAALQRIEGNSPWTSWIETGPRALVQGGLPRLPSRLGEVATSVWEKGAVPTWKATYARAGSLRKGVFSRIRSEARINRRHGLRFARSRAVAAGALRTFGNVTLVRPIWRGFRQRSQRIALNDIRALRSELRELRAEVRTNFAKRRELQPHIDKLEDALYGPARARRAAREAQAADATEGISSTSEASPQKVPDSTASTPPPLPKKSPAAPEAAKTPATRTDATSSRAPNTRERNASAERTPSSAEKARFSPAESPRKAPGESEVRSPSPELTKATDSAVRHLQEVKNGSLKGRWLGEPRERPFMRGRIESVDRSGNLSELVRTVRQHNTEMRDLFGTLTNSEKAFFRRQMRQKNHMPADLPDNTVADMLGGDDFQFANLRDASVRARMQYIAKQRNDLRFGRSKASPIDTRAFEQSFRRSTDVNHATVEVRDQWLRGPSALRLDNGNIVLPEDWLEAWLHGSPAPPSLF